MLWPFVRRSELDLCRKERRQALALHRESQQRAITAERTVDILQGQLERSELERTSATLKLVRVGFGINPFAEEFTQQTSVLPQGSDAEPPRPAIGPDSSPAEVQASFVREAAERFGNDLRKISRYVEQKQAEFYAHRPAPAIVSPAEIAQAEQVRRDLEAAIEEGAREAAKG